MQTIQQQRAKFALTEVQGYLKHLLDRVEHELRQEPDVTKHESIRKRNKAKIDKAKDEYKSYASALPAMIHINGLGQAVAFYKSKGDTHQILYQLLSDWLTQPKQPYASEKDLMQAIVDNDMHRYRLAQAEAQALMDWVKKFAKAYMTED
jgi:CRISPR-associated protein Cmr5